MEDYNRISGGIPEKESSVSKSDSMQDRLLQGGFSASGEGSGQAVFSSLSEGGVSGQAAFCEPGEGEGSGQGTTDRTEEYPGQDKIEQAPESAPEGDGKNTGEAATDREQDSESIAEEKRRARKDARTKAFIEEALSWIKSFIIMFCIALFLTQFIIINAVIPSGSMEDTIMTHDRLIGARFSYWLSEPERGDIVIFHYPVDEKRIYIKRIIGLPGETVRIMDGRIYIDDSAEPLSEGYLKEEWDVMNSNFEFHVPEDCYLMLGDNRNWSEDSRYWAENALDEGVAFSQEEAEQYNYVRKNKILGKAIFTYFRKFRILRHGEWYE